MSISFNVYLPALKTILREDLAARCRDLHWAVLMRVPLASGTANFIKPEGVLSPGDHFYGADSRRLSDPEIHSALIGSHLNVLHATSGGEAIISINDEFDIHDLYDHDSLDELSTTDEKLVERLKNAKVHLEVEGGSYFALQLSEVLGRMGCGVWEDPQADEWVIM